MKCAQPPPPPKTLGLTAHACLQTDTLCNNTTQHVPKQYTHKYTPATSQQPSKQRTNQPTNEPAKLSRARTNQPTTNQRTQQPTKQTRKPTANQPTSQVQVHTGGGGFRNLGGGGTKHTIDPHSTMQNPARGGGGAREEGWWEGGTCTLGNPIPQTHMAGRREGVTHLPLGVTVYPLLHPNQKTSTPTKRKCIPSLTLSTTSRGPTTQTTTWKGGEGALIAQHRGCVCAVLVFGLLASLPTLDIVSCVLCCAYAFAKLCVCWGGGGHMRMHASSVLLAMSVCVMHPSTHCDNFLWSTYSTTPGWNDLCSRREPF